MLVEDDNNLREIYEARLAAEGYEIISAKDGEEALATAVKEKPNLILCDVMMPKISGFDMLDILRSTDGIKNTKVIMMTALSQAEDKARADKLGADRYLVKSQVTLEDMAKVVHDVLEGTTPDAAAAQPTPAVSAPEIKTADTAASVGHASSGPVGISAVSNATTDPRQSAADNNEDNPAGAPLAAVNDAASTSEPLNPQQAPTDTSATVNSATSDVSNTTQSQPAVIATTPAVDSSQAPTSAAVSGDDSSAFVNPAATTVPDVSNSSTSTNTVSQDTASSVAAAENLSQSSVSEETAIKNQIDSFINQQAEPELPIAVPIVTDSITSQSTTSPFDTSASSTQVIQPSSDSTPTAAPVQNNITAGFPPNDGVTVKGKKIIQPPDPNSGGKSNLDELLAKEEAKAPIDTTPIVVSSGEDTPKNVASSSTPVEPHLPGHVITPPTQNSDIPSPSAAVL